MSDLAQRLAGTRVVVCAGPGGVGKTTISATVAIGLAVDGHRVAVVTIDPARRLAEALGLQELSNEPQRLDLDRFKRGGLDIQGELSAMMLDVKRTFDELIERLAPDVATAHAILANPIYTHISNAVAGSQEYTAVSKVFDLVAEDHYDVIVMDTPPSRSAIDFLTAPERLTAFFEGRAMSAFLRPTGAAAHAVGVVFAALRRVTGVGLLDDLTTFFALIGRLLEGFRTRATEVQRLLTDPATGFLVVTSAERPAVSESLFFCGQLEQAAMRQVGVIVNRVHELDPTERDEAAVAASLVSVLGSSLAGKVAQTHAELQLLARRDEASLERVRTALHDANPICVTDREADVRDVDGLIATYRELFA